MIFQKQVTDTVCDDIARIKELQYMNEVPFLVKSNFGSFSLLIITPIFLLHINPFSTITL